MPATELMPESKPQTILVVEDEILVRMVIADYLRDCGYHVIEAGTATEALVVLQSSQTVDIVFSDVQMPGEMDGFGLSRWVRQNRPGLRVLLTSGNARAVQTAGDLCAEGPVEVKPYHPQAIHNRIQRLLQEQA
jgi:CheY-like chemotaxis protein